MQRKIKLKQKSKDIKVMNQNRGKRKSEPETKSKPIEESTEATTTTEDSVKVAKKTETTTSVAATSSTSTEPIESVDSDSLEAIEGEDQFEDEVETIKPEDFNDADDDDDADADTEGDENMSMKDMKDEITQIEVWNPFTRPLEDGEELVCEPSAYDMLHRLNSEWPCLSFDILRDTLGPNRTRFPHTLYLAAGTQADMAKRNKISIMKLSKLRRTKHDRREDKGEDEPESDNELIGSDEEIGEEELVDEDPLVEVRDIKHDGGVNRIRSNPHAPHLLATWADTGKVHMWNAAPWLKALDTPGTAKLPTVAKPLQSLNHRSEGFAMDWAPLEAAKGCLLTGDCVGGIYLWRPNEGASAWSGEGPFKGHSGSVEDLQWSPSEAAVFASCSTDGTIRVWDARQKNAAALRVCRAHKTDVNVISWNRFQSFLMASGADDGSFRVWDLRALRDDAPISDFKYHPKAITSIEWSSYDESTLAVASEDNSISIWDLSLEEDVETDENGDEEMVDNNGMVVPPQLMFVHMGQSEIKELHWHPQIPKTIVSTAFDGFNIFKPENL